MSKANRFLTNESGQMSSVAIGAVLALIVVGVLLYVGISIMEGVTDSAALASGDTFYNTSATITTGVESAFGLTSVLLLVIIASAIISLLMYFAISTQQG